jgi:hypothetical protein
MEKEFKIIVKVPAELEGKVTDHEIEEWVKFEVGYSGRMSSNNPLAFHSLETIDVTEY